MRKLILVALLAAAAVVAARSISRWRARVAYEEFAEAWTHGDAKRAGELAEAGAAERALEKRSLRGLPNGPIMEAFRGTRYAIESESRNAAGDMEIEATQTILFDPPGITTALGGAMYTHVHHSATLRHSSGGWKVIAFETKVIDIGEVRRR